MSDEERYTRWVKKHQTTPDYLRKAVVMAFLTLTSDKLPSTIPRIPLEVLPFAFLPVVRAPSKPCKECWCVSNCCQQGHVECLEMLAASQDISLCWEDSRVAAFSGHFDMLKWLCEHDCPCDDRTTHAAASRGHLDCLKYLCENERSSSASEGRCPINPDVFEWESLKDYPECLLYLQEMVEKK